ncbi:AbrB/MazE/SpoVT family DNA-binding domain-containing protein [Anaeroselena agilis]|uniref:AbrB/MazE/SpoVT family DNA-binding domain-containing protein n=1 Tax=Anaeroselena agilis TaxID=3063788 RepID=A0ABU3NUJ7_9FIRM|nr:AbrB/MazE/SpoVT family DNA-binding domain-containing protein [Selenomonadales bacterium 4137-cl]
MEVRKVFKAGNSSVVSLPFEMLKALGLKDGSHVSVELNREKRELVLKPVVVKSGTVSLDFVRLVDKLLIDYDFVLRRLSK